jgi:hypothetical protein
VFLSADDCLRRNTALTVIAMSKLMMAMTTSSSINVNPARR